MGRAVGADVDAIGFTTAGVGAVELPIHEEIPPRYPLLLLLLVLAVIDLAAIFGATALEQSFPIVKVNAVVLLLTVLSQARRS